MIVITKIVPKYSQHGPVAAFRVGLKNMDGSRTAKGNIVVSASNMKDVLSESKDGEGIKEMELPPNADDETDIPLEPSVLIEHGQTHYNILISNI
jgi:hypothetical protein